VVCGQGGQRNMEQVSLRISTSLHIWGRSHPHGLKKDSYVELELLEVDRLLTQIGRHLAALRRQVQVQM
jgi:hypothetical protein